MAYEKCSEILKRLPSGVDPVDKFIEVYINRERFYVRLKQVDEELVKKYEEEKEKIEQEYQKYLRIATGKCIDESLIDEGEYEGQLLQYQIPHAVIAKISNAYPPLASTIKPDQINYNILHDRMKQVKISENGRLMRIKTWKNQRSYQYWLSDIKDDPDGYIPFDEWMKYAEDEITLNKTFLRRTREDLKVINMYKDMKYVSLPHVHRIYLESEMSRWTSRQTPKTAFEKMVKLCKDLKFEVKELYSVYFDGDKEEGYAELFFDIYREVLKDIDLIIQNYEWMSKNKEDPCLITVCYIIALCEWEYNDEVLIGEPYEYIASVFRPKILKHEKSKHFRITYGNPTSGTVVITTPHSYCRPRRYPKRHCDRMAGPASDSLNKFFDVLKIPYQEFESLDFRSKMDMNRRPSRDSSKYRAQITQFVKTHKVLLNLDVHSYPETDQDKGDIYIINADGKTTGYEKSFMDWLYKTLGEKYKVRHGPYTYDRKRNDIQDEMRKAHEVDSILVEFKEQLPKKQLERVCAMISLWVRNSYFDSNKFDFRPPNNIVMDSDSDRMHERFLGITKELIRLGFKVHWVNVMPEERKDVVHLQKLLQETKSLREGLSVSYTGDIDTGAKNFDFKI